MVRSHDRNRASHSPRIPYHPDEIVLTQCQHQTIDPLRIGQRTDTQVSVDTGIARSSSQVLVLPVRNVEMCLWISVFLCQAKVNYINLVSTLSDPHEKVVGLDVTVDK